MTTIFSIVNGMGLAAPQGDLTALTAGAFREEFAAWFAVAGVRNVVLDLSLAAFIDSTGLGALIALLKRVSENGGDLSLAGLQKKARMVLEITRTHRIFEIYETVGEATRNGR